AVESRRFQSPRPGNRWCGSPSASTASTPPAVTPISSASRVFCSAAFNVSLTAATRRAMVRTSSTRIVSRAATASTTTKPPITAPHHRVSLESLSSGVTGTTDRTLISAFSTPPDALQRGEDLGRVVDGGVQLRQGRGVAHRVAERGVDGPGLAPDPVREQQDRYDERDDHEHDD